MVARNLLVIDGVLGAGAERFSVGIHYAVEPGGGALLGSADLQAWVDATTARWASSGATVIRAELGATSSIVRHRAYAYAASGPAVATATSTSGLPIAGSGTGVHPFQISRAVSLTTNLASRRARGRFYWPALVASVSTTTGKSTPPTGLVGAWAQLLSDWGSDAPGDVVLTPVIYSRVGDALNEVSSVRIGDVLDTQRRRRDGLVESYVSALVPPAS